MVFFWHSPNPYLSPQQVSSCYYKWFSQYILTHIHTYILSDFINILEVDPLFQRESPESDFYFLIFCKNSFWRLGLDMFPTILGQKQKSKKLNFSENFLSVGKSPLRGKNQIWLFRKNSFSRVGFYIFPTFLGQKLKYFFWKKMFKKIQNFFLKIFQKCYVVKNVDFVDTYLLTKFGVGMSYCFQDIAIYDSYDVIIMTS